MSLLNKRDGLKPLWLSLALGITALFGFGSIACAQICNGANCTEISKGHPPAGQPDLHHKMVCGLVCSLCINIIPTPITADIKSQTSPQLYFTSLKPQSSRYIAPDIPPPRRFEFI
jgi:hypothetical protein